MTPILAEIRHTPLLWLLVVAPVVLLAEHLWPDRDAVLFILSVMAIIPLAALLSRATESVAARTGDAIGGLLNATLGNLTELVIAITAQQVSLFAAAAIRSRFVERYGEPGTYAHAFPERERVARANEAELVSLGFSRRKAEYVIGLARSDLDLEGLAALPDEEVAARVVALRGLGEWTADWFLARHLARPHAWPAGDLGLRKAVATFYGDVPDVRAFGARFHPFQNLSAHYLLTGSRLPA